MEICDDLHVGKDKKNNLRIRTEQLEELDEPRKTGTDPNLEREVDGGEGNTNSLLRRLSAAFSLALTQTEHIRARRTRCQTKRNALIKARRGESY